MVLQWDPYLLSQHEFVAEYYISCSSADLLKICTIPITDAADEFSLLVALVRPDLGHFLGWLRDFARWLCNRLRCICSFSR